jgi:hypothetical protein
MRDYYEDDPKKPVPVRDARKGSNPSEVAERGWRPLLKDEDRDHHRHVV